MGYILTLVSYQKRADLYEAQTFWPWRSGSDPAVPHFEASSFSFLSLPPPSSPMACHLWQGYASQRTTRRAAASTTGRRLPGSCATGVDSWTRPRSSSAGCATTPPTSWPTYDTTFGFTRASGPSSAPTAAKGSSRRFRWSNTAASPACGRGRRPPLPRTTVPCWVTAHCCRCRRRIPARSADRDSHARYSWFSMLFGRMRRFTEVSSACLVSRLQLYVN